MTHRARSTRAAVLFAVLMLVMVPAAIAGGNAPLVVASSPHDVPTTVKRLETAVKAKGAQVVATVDHGAAAQANGLPLRPTVLVLFGNPKLGTPLMQSQQTAGLELPLHVLVWQDADGATRLGYAAPERIAERHGITDRGDVVARMTGVLAAITGEAAAP
jgi:uncharacterized protein (DUF302 family)